MRAINESKRLFFRSFFMSAVICLCLGFGLYGTAKAYENTRAIGFGDDRKALTYDNGVLQILDFEIEIIKK